MENVKIPRVKCDDSVEFRIFPPTIIHVELGIGRNAHLLLRLS